MTLPYDIARCDGRMVNRTQGPIAAALFPDKRLHSDCVQCRRRDPGRSDQQPSMAPPVFVGGTCPEWIEK